MKMLLHELDDREWHFVSELIPSADAASAARRDSLRSYVDAILWRMRTGGPWRLIPRTYGDSTTIFRYQEKWRKAGVWGEITTTLAQLRMADQYNIPEIPQSPVETK
jgi:transposase